MNVQAKFQTGRMTSKGQILIPKALRDEAGLKPNELVDIEMGDDGRIKLSPARPKESPEERRARIRAALEASVGKYPNPEGMTTDEYMKWLRGGWEP